MTEAAPLDKVYCEILETLSKTLAATPPELRGRYWMWVMLKTTEFQLDVQDYVLALEAAKTMRLQWLLDNMLVGATSNRKAETTTQGVEFQ